MNFQPGQEELIEYKVIDLAEIFKDIQIFKNAKDATEVKERIKTITADVINEPVELCGKTSLVFVLLLFTDLTCYADEVIYRTDQKNKQANIIFSRLNPDQFIHPFGVEEPAEWTEKELAALNEKRVQDKKKTVEIDLAAEWQQAAKQKNQLKDFLQQIYSINRDKQEVKLSDEIPILPALLVASWFSQSKGKIYYEDILLSTHE
ncbi:MAG: hypothetical protein ABII72_02105 [Parcubacteria group bacterium]